MKELETHLMSYEKKIGRINLLIDGVVKSRVNSILISGPPGIGKSFSIEKRLQFHEENSQIRFTVTKGHMTPMSMYNMMCERSSVNDIIVFDDCDAVLFNTDALNLLKAASELTTARRVAWHGRARIPEIIFNGKIIVITNIKFRNNPHLSAVLDRVHAFDLEVSFSEKLAKIVDISKTVMENYSETCDPTDIVSFLLYFQNVIDQSKITLRTFQKLYELKLLVNDEWVSYMKDMLYVTFTKEISNEVLEDKSRYLKDVSTLLPYCP